MSFLPANLIVDINLNSETLGKAKQAKNLLGINDLIHQIVSILIFGISTFISWPTNYAKKGANVYKPLFRSVRLTNLYTVKFVLI